MSKRDEEVGRFLVIDAARIGAVDEGVSLQVRIDGAHFFDQARHFFERPLSCGSPPRRLGCATGRRAACFVGPRH